MLVGCGVAAFGGVPHWMVNNDTPPRAPYQASSPSREYSKKAAASAHNILTRHIVPLVCKLLQLFVILCMLTIY
jgi:hypothetical protein